MKTKNSSGPKTVPSGSPLRTSTLSGVAPSTVTCWVPSVRKALSSLGYCLSHRSGPVSLAYVDKEHDQRLEEIKDYQAMLQLLV